MTGFRTHVELSIKELAGSDPEEQALAKYLLQCLAQFDASRKQEADIKDWVEKLIRRVLAEPGTAEIIDPLVACSKNFPNCSASSAGFALRRSECACERERARMGGTR